MARGEAGPESDIDLLIEVDRARPGFFELFELKEGLEAPLGRCQPPFGPAEGMRRSANGQIVRRRKRALTRDARYHLERDPEDAHRG